MNKFALIQEMKTASPARRRVIQSLLDQIIAEEEQEKKAKARNKKRISKGPPEGPRKRGRGNPNVASFDLYDGLVPNFTPANTLAIPTGYKIAN